MAAADPFSSTTASAAAPALGIDVGGTFVDFALAVPGGGLVTHKVLAEPADLAGSVLQGLAELAALGGQSRDELLRGLPLIVHGTTVATNAVLTHEGSRVGLLTTAGTRDALEMRRGIKEEVLNNKYAGPPPLVPRYLRLPVVERLDSAGEVLTPWDPASVDQALEVLAAQQVEAVAICFMHAYANDAHERAVAERVRVRLPGAYVTLSSELMPQLGYYQRVSTAVLNSYVGPLLSAYLLTLDARLRGTGFGGGLLIVNSTGGVMAPAEIARRAAAALVSGPAAGPIAGRLYAERQDSAHCAVIDMGGTSLDMSLVWDGEPLVTAEGTIGRYALALPMIDIRTIGAGGGSIGWLDDGGVLHVGPQSAGAAPGPACYGRGGTLPTCTDANVLLGYVAPDSFLGGRMRLDCQAAERAVRDHLATPLGLSTDEAAVAMFEVIGASMSTGIRDMIVDRGLDPRALPLVVGGGAGPVHAGALAAELEIARVLIPRESAVFCATGMLFADLKYDLVQSYCVPLPRLDRDRWRAYYEGMAHRGQAALVAQRAPPASITVRYAADLRYTRQLHELTVPLSATDVAEADGDALHARFDALHERLFGYCLPDHALELVNVRATVVGRLPRPALPRLETRSRGAPAPRDRRRAYVPSRGTFEMIAVYGGEDLGPGGSVAGPALVELPQTTIVVPANFRLDRDDYGTFVLQNLNALASAPEALATELPTAVAAGATPKSPTTVRPGSTSKAPTAAQRGSTP
jgi:N-methylhydantoinase A